MNLFPRSYQVLREAMTIDWPDVVGLANRQILPFFIILIPR